MFVENEINAPRGLPQVILLFPQEIVEMSRHASITLKQGSSLF